MHRGRSAYVTPLPPLAAPTARPPQRRWRPAATAVCSSGGGSHGRVVAVAATPKGAASLPGTPLVRQQGEGVPQAETPSRAVVSTELATAAAASASGERLPLVPPPGWADEVATADVAGVSPAPPPGWADEVAASDMPGAHRGWADNVVGVVDMDAWDRQRLANLAARVCPPELASPTASPTPTPPAAPLTPIEAAAAATARRRELRRLRRAVAHEAAGGHVNAVDDAGTPFAAYASRVVANLAAAAARGGVWVPRLATARLITALDRYDDLSASARVELAARLAAYPALPPTVGCGSAGNGGGGKPTDTRASRHAALLRTVRALTPPAAVSAAPNWRWLAVPRSWLRASSSFLPLPPVPQLVASWAARWSAASAAATHGGSQGVPAVEYRRLRPDTPAADAVRGVVEVTAGDAWRLLGLGGGVLGAPPVASPSTATLMAEAAAAAAAATAAAAAATTTTTTAASVTTTTTGAATAPAPRRAVPPPVPYFPLPPRRVHFSGGQGVRDTPVGNSYSKRRSTPLTATTRTTAARVAAAAAREQARIWSDALPAWVSLTCPAVRGAPASTARRALYGPSAALRGALAAAHVANGVLAYLRLVNPGGGRPDRVRLEEVGVCVAAAADVRRAAAGRDDVPVAAAASAAIAGHDGVPAAAPTTKLPTIGADIAAVIRHRDAASHGAWAATPTRILLVDVVCPFVEAPPPARAPPRVGPYYRLAPLPPPTTLPAATYATAQLSLLAAGPTFTSAVVLLTAPTMGAALFTVRRDGAFLAAALRALGGLVAAYGGAVPPPRDYWATNADCRAVAAAAAKGVAATGAGRVVSGADAEGGLPITVGVDTPWNGGNREDGAEPRRWARLSPFLDYVGGAGGGGEEEGAMGR